MEGNMAEGKNPIFNLMTRKSGLELNKGKSRKRKIAGISTAGRRLSGYPGDPGKPGIGIKSDRCHRGERGFTGKVLRLDGQVVVPGEKSKPGEAGLIGQTGPRGICGLPEYMGRPGLNGEEGDSGINSRESKLGPPGYSSRDGDQGNKGEKGERGLPAKPASFGGSIVAGPTGLSGPPGPPGGSNGDTGPGGDFDYYDNEVDKNAPFIVGPRGEPSPPSAPGPLGADGTSGSTRGHRGANGDKPMFGGPRKKRPKCRYKCENLNVSNKSPKSITNPSTTSTISNMDHPMEPTDHMGERSAITTTIKPTLDITSKKEHKSMDSLMSPWEIATPSTDPYNISLRLRKTTKTKRATMDNSVQIHTKNITKGASTPVLKPIPDSAYSYLQELPEQEPVPQESVEITSNKAFQLDLEFGSDKVQTLLENLTKPEPLHQPFYFPQQMCRSKVLREKIEFAFRYYQGKTLKDFNKFELAAIYTANNDSLRNQTIGRAIDPDARIFTDTFYHMSIIEQKGKIKRKVGKYCLTEDVREYHLELKRRTKGEHDTLFIIVADEAHWGITRKTKDERDGDSERVEAKNANDTLINEWNWKHFPNVVVLQVSATPWNLLTSESRLSSLEVARYNHDMVAIRGEQGWGKFCAKSATTPESECMFVRKRDLGVARPLHRIDWSDGFQEELRNGISALIQIPCKYGGIQWLTFGAQGNNSPKLGSTTERRLASRFTIKMANPKVGTVKLTVKYRNRLSGKQTYVLAEHVNQIAFFPKKKMKPHTHHPEFHYVANYGEDVFQLQSTDKREIHHEITDSGLQLSLERLSIASKHFPLASLPSSFILYSYQDESVLPDLPEDKTPKNYLSLNSYYNSMRHPDRKRRLIRADSLFQGLSKEVTGRDKGITPDAVLTADYCLMVLLTTLLNTLSVKDIMLDIKENIFLQQRSDLFLHFEEILDKYDDKKKNHNQHRTISKQVFQYVKGYYSQSASNLVNHFEQSSKIQGSLLELYLKVLFFGTKKSFNQLRDIISSDKTLEEILLAEDFTSVQTDIVNQYESFRIVEDLVLDLSPSNGKINKDGKMKIIRVSNKSQGNIMYASLCAARKVAQNIFPYIYFEVFRHYGNDKNFTTLDYNETETMMALIRRGLQTDKCQSVNPHTLNTCKKNCNKYVSKKNTKDLRCNNCGHVHKELTEFKDLQGLPCIVILVEKGRLGDTFPEGLNVMDLRLRGNTSVPVYTSLAQELGRLCRYVVKTEANEKLFPYALVGSKLEQQLRDSLKNSASIYGYAVKNDRLDHYVDVVSQRGDEYGEKVICELKPTKDNFDYFDEGSDHREPDPNRFLLKAEPQIGKTGVYLHLLKDFNDYFQVDKEDTSVDDEDSCASDTEVTEEVKGTTHEFLACDWKYPHWKFMKEQKALPKEVHHSKYQNVYGPYVYGVKPKDLTSQNRLRTRKDKLYKARRVLNKDPVINESRRFNALTSSHKADCAKCRKPIPASVYTLDLFGCKFEISIPLSKHFEHIHKKFSDSKETALEVSGPHRLKTWIFTPTHARSKRANLNLSHTMTDSGVRVGYYHVLVVRRKQFLAYRKEWQHSHIIIAMSDKMRDSTQKIARAETGGVGYARLFIQRFASALDLDHILMLDDNITVILEAQEEVKDGKMVMRRGPGGLVLEPVPMYKVFNHLEKMMICIAVPPRYDVETYTQAPHFLIESYTGPISKYGALGISKFRPGSRRVVHAFKKTHVYSFVYLNIKQLKEKKIEYHPQKVFEDLTLNNDMDLKGLWVTKSNRFQLRKRNLSDWVAELYQWTDDTVLGNQTPLKNNNSEVPHVAISWVKYQAWPQRFSLVDVCTGYKTDEHCFDRHLTSYPLLKTVVGLKPGKEHFVAFTMEGDLIEKKEMLSNIQRYFSKTPGIGGYEKHIIYISSELCVSLGLVNLKEIKQKVITPCFAEDVLHFTVTTHRVPHYWVSYVLIYVEGKILNPYDAYSVANMRAKQPVSKVPASKPGTSGALTQSIAGPNNNETVTPRTRRRTRSNYSNHIVPSPSPSAINDQEITDDRPTTIEDLVQKVQDIKSQMLSCLNSVELATELWNKLQNQENDSQDLYAFESFKLKKELLEAYRIGNKAQLKIVYLANQQKEATEVLKLANQQKEAQKS